MEEKTFSRRFLYAFSIIESVFKSWNDSKNNISFSNYVHRYSKRNDIIRQYRDNLLEYSQLRNAIVHDRAGNNSVIAEPHESVVKEIEHIAKMLTKPPLIKDIPLKDIVVCQIDDDFSSVLKKMSEHGFSQMPVLDGVMVVNVLDSSMALHYLYNHVNENNQIDLKYVKVRDVVEMDRTEHFKLVYEDETIHDVISLFQVQQEKGSALRAIVVLNNESRRKGPIAIITVKDLPKLLSYIQ
ncbi:MAG: CBS domain-containing protein [Erysipelothrix sp.]|nr:CBS domain-containing protein [Erysipelothrix sp.]